MRRRLKLLQFCSVLCILLFTLVSNVKAQMKKLTGTVIASADNLPISGVSVTVVGTTRGTVTNAEGQFTLSVPSNAGKLLFSEIGFVPKTVSIGSTTDFNVFLDISVDSTNDEVIVTAGGVLTKRKEIGTAQTTVSGSVLTAGKAVNIAGGLQGKVPGLMISGSTGGVNPNFRIVLRGNRSLTGNNEALIVLDNVIVPNEILGNINPEDVESINVLQGAGAAALYGSKASNGAIVITTKQGKKGYTQVRIANTSTLEHLAFWPKMQNTYGQGGSAYDYDENGNPIYSAIENQSYGPAYNGSRVPLGDSLEDGSQQYVSYSGNDSRKKFWKTGYTNQTDFSINSGDDISTLYLSGQYADVKGTTPKDRYNRTTLRVNGTRKLFNKTLLAQYSIGYTQNRYDQTTATSSIYNNMLNMPSNIDITSYANWETDPFANPNGYYNPWYLNPYWQIDNLRSKTRNDYLVGNLQLTYSPTKWLDLTARQGITTRNYSTKGTGASFDYTAYAEASSSQSKSDIPAYVNDAEFYTTNLLSDLFMQIHTKKSDFTFNFIGGGQWNQNEYKYVGVSANPLVVPDLYNVSNLVGIPGASESNYKARIMGFYGDLRVGYKGFIYLHGTGRNDWNSILNPNNRSFFYPSVDVSFIASSALSFLKNSNTINLLKLRAGWSKVGQVNLGSSTDFGAYYLQRTFSQQNGFPYNSLAGFGLDNTLVSDNLKPEFTKQLEFGFDLNLFKDRITSTVTWFHGTTDNQTVTPGISSASGGSAYRTNAGTTMSQGLEVALNVTPIRTNNWEVNVGANYYYLDNKVKNITADLPRIALSSYSDGSGSYAAAGFAFPEIFGFDYVRDPKGRVIVDAVTGLPTKNTTLQPLGNAVAKNSLGIPVSVRFKNFRVSALFDYRGGYKMYFGNGSDFDWAGTGIRSTTFNRERFVFPNSVYEDPSNPGNYIENNSITIGDGNGNAGFWTDALNREVTSNYISSGAFWKLREMSISYTVPDAVLEKTHFIKSATISVQGRNLFIWLPKSNLYTDPEYSEVSSTSNGVGITGLSSAPPSRFYGATLSLTF